MFYTFRRAGATEISPAAARGAPELEVEVHKSRPFQAHQSTVQNRPSSRWPSIDGMHSVTAKLGHLDTGMPELIRRGWQVEMYACHAIESVLCGGVRIRRVTFEANIRDTNPPVSSVAKIPDTQHL